MGAHAGGGGGGSQTQTVLTGTVQLDNDAIIALADNILDVLPDADVGSFYNLISGLVVIDARAVPYGNINASANMYLAASGQQSSIVSAAQLSPLLGGDGEIAWITITAESATYGEASGSQSLRLLCSNNGDGPFTGGDAANSGYIKVFYTLEDVPS